MYGGTLVPMILSSMCSSYNLYRFYLNITRSEDLAREEVVIKSVNTTGHGVRTYKPSNGPVFRNGNTAPVF